MITVLILFLTWLFAGAISGDLRSLAIWLAAIALGAGVLWHEYRRRR